MTRGTPFALRSERRPMDARESVDRALEKIAAKNKTLACFTHVFAEEAKAAAAAFDHPAPSATPHGLAGMPFAAKDLFDIAGSVTTAGAKPMAGTKPVSQDAAVVSRLKERGAILVGTCNMDEHAYGFVTINAHYGTTRNPHDTTRLAGGSSGGSAAAVAAGLVPLALGSDTNGSIRVPAALCGVYGLRPTHGDLPVDGMAPFVDSLDVPGPIAGSLDVLRDAWIAMAKRQPREPNVSSLRIARLGGWFTHHADAATLSALEGIAKRLRQPAIVEWPEAERARSAAYVITAAEGGARHLPALRERPEAFDPATRDRLLAGAVIPAVGLLTAQRFKAWFDRQMEQFWREVDVVLAPCVPCVAPKIDDPTIEIDGARVAARASLGMLTQPISLAGCPALAAPLLRPGQLPLGIQLVAAPGREGRLFALAEQLELAGLTGVSAPGAG